MKRIINLILNWFFLFAVFVPWGYLPWFWALPASIVATALLFRDAAKKKEANSGC